MTNTASKKGLREFIARAMLMLIIFSGAIAASPSMVFAKATTVTLRYGTDIWYGSEWYGHTSQKWVTHIDGEAVDLDDVAGVSRSYAYCVQPTANAPDEGTYPVTVIDDDDTGKVSTMRKFIYYLPGSYGYTKVTKKRWFSGYSANEAYAIGHLALSWIYDGYSDGGIWGGCSSSMKSDTKDMVSDLKNLADPPDDFEVFWVKVGGKQDIFGAFYHTEYGKVKVTKASANTAVTNGNSEYSLEGAEFTLYNDEACKEKATFKDGSAAVIKTKADGSSNEYEIETGEYYIKETKAPKGYALDSKVHKIEVKNNQTYTYSCKDTAIMNLVNMLLTKKGKDYPNNHGEGDATFAGAVYKFSYYDGQYSSVSAAEGSGKSTATWYFETNASGEISGTSPKTASGYTSSALYKDSDGKVAFPLGSYVIQEVKAPTGYILNSEKQLVNITEDGMDNAHIKMYNEKTSSSEDIIRGGVKFAKIDHDRNTAVPQGDATLEGAEFTVYNKSKESVMVGGKEIAKDAAALVIKTDSGGKAASAAKDLPYGTYLVKETKAPTGYHLNETWSKTFSIRTDGEVKDLSAEPADENVQRGGVKVQKVDKDLKRAYAQGDATLAGAEFTITNQSAQSVIVGGKEYAKGAVVMTIKTDANGAAATANNVLPYGTYSIKETKPSTGYLLNTTWAKTFEIREPNKIVDLGGDATDEPIIRGGVKIAKIDNDLDEAYAQGDATLAGAEFTIYNKSAHNVYVDGKEQAKDAAVLVIKTDANGIAATSADALPYGTYLIKETKPSAGYLLNTEWNTTFQIRENGKIIDLTENKVREAVERGGVQIVKRDKELSKSEAMGGASLADIVFAIKNVSNHDVVVRSDFADASKIVDWKKLASKKELFDKEEIKRVKPGEDVGKIVTHWNEEKKAYTAETLADDLPYGTYTIRETKTNSSYQRTDKTEHQFEVRKDGTVYAYDSEGLESILTFDDYVYRSDLQGTKIGDGDSRRFSYVPFKITSVSNGETHVVVADNNGFFSTKDRRTADELEEEEGADTARKVNPFDDLLEATDIKKADLQKRSSEMLMGVWFGTGESGSTAEMNPKFGALPYDSYIIEEIPCDENEGYTMQKFFFTVDQKSQNGFVDLETITDDIPEIGTTASVDGKNADVSPSKEITLTDTIEHSGLKKLTKYVAKGRLVDKATGEVIKDASGKEITAEKEFTTVLSRGKVKVTFTFDGSNMYGKETVVFETVYDMEGHVIAKHEDVNDEGQTITWREEEKPKIGTTLTADGKKEVLSSEKTVLTDEIEYKALDTSKWYVFEGTLMVKEKADPLVENGKPVTVTSEPFKPEAPDGKQCITFTIDTRGLEGKELVAFETAYRLDSYEKGSDINKAAKTAVAEHKDINDKGQTVRIIKPDEPVTPPAITETPKTPEKPKTPDKPTTPETGDSNMLRFFAALLITAALGLTAFAGREAQRKIRQRREDREILKN